ncbi:MAG: response regulator [Elusimicrobia bacterium]|nr:response regulator [Elusimicrobiota bacterium]
MMAAPEPGRALVVDDDENVAAVCRRVLEGLGLGVESAASAKEAWERMLAARFDFVLTDINMADSRAGVTLAEEVKNRWPETDVVMMTGLPGLETAIPSLKTGVFDYLIKPFPNEQLSAVARRLLGMRRLARELEREKLLRAELSAAYAELQKVERLKEALLSRVSHELRTPVAIGRMAAELLKDEVPSPAGKDVLERLAGALERMQAVVEDLILFARTRAEGLPLNKAQTDLQALLERLVEAHKPLWQGRGVSVKLSAEGVPRPILADERLLEAAFTRLLLNAIQFNRKEGRIAVSTAYWPAEVAVAFSDTGAGVALDEGERIFDGLYQAAEHMTREVGGLGVGLAVARSIVEAHGGELSVKSRPGEGSVFTVRLPIPSGDRAPGPASGRSWPARRVGEEVVEGRPTGDRQGEPS